MSKIALCGAHRTGKSKLGMELADALKIPFLESIVTKVMTKHGYACNESLRYPLRLNAQSIISDAYVEYFSAHHSFISDRCHLDFLMYAFMEVGNDFPGSLTVQSMFDSYVETCLNEIKKLDALYLLQPGIPIVAAEGKGSAVKPLLDKLNALALGLIADYNLPCVVIPKDCLDLQSRKDFVIADLQARDLV